MKKLFLNFVFVLLIAPVFGQDNHPKELLLAYTQEELTTLQKEQPEDYQVLLYALKTGGYYIAENPVVKQLQISRNIDLPKGKFNFATLGIKITEDIQFFGINGSNKLLVVKAMPVIKYEYLNQK